jgi:hypothetical protein
VCPRCVEHFEVVTPGLSPDLFRNLLMLQCVRSELVREAVCTVAEHAHSCSSHADKIIPLAWNCRKTHVDILFNVLREMQLN